MRLLIPLSLCILFNLALAQSKSVRDEDESWADFFRFLLDIFNLSVQAWQFCGPSSPEGECRTFLVLSSVSIAVFVLFLAFCKYNRINVDRNRCVEDALRVYATGQSVSRIAHWTKRV